MIELRIDPAIRVWVFLPIFLITYLIEVLRHYVYVLLVGQKTVTMSQIECSQAIKRSRLLQQNGKYLTAKSFAMRKSYFNNQERGYFLNRQMPETQLFTNYYQDMIASSLLNIVPMILIGSWINAMFSGFVTTKVPFPLTLRFKPMLQAGIALASLDAAWVSSASWYIITIFGLRPIYMLMVAEKKIFDPVRAEMESINTAASSVGTDMKALFKAEWEALELAEYTDALKDIDAEIMKIVLEEEEK